MTRLKKKQGCICLLSLKSTAVLLLCCLLYCCAFSTVVLYCCTLLYEAAVPVFSSICSFFSFSNTLRYATVRYAGYATLALLPPCVSASPWPHVFWFCHLQYEVLLQSIKYPARVEQSGFLTFRFPSLVFCQTLKLGRRRK